MCLLLFGYLCLRIFLGKNYLISEIHTYEIVIRKADTCLNKS